MPFVGRVRGHIFIMQVVFQINVVGQSLATRSIEILSVSYVTASIFISHWIKNNIPAEGDAIPSIWE